jgi:hypothetical protein
VDHPFAQEAADLAARPRLKLESLTSPDSSRSSDRKSAMTTQTSPQVQPADHDQASATALAAVQEALDRRDNGGAGADRHGH